MNKPTMNIVQELCDPIVWLNEECMVHVLSFLVGGPNEKAEEPLVVVTAMERVEEDNNNEDAMDVEPINDNNMEEDEDDESVAAVSTDSENDDTGMDETNNHNPGPFWRVNEAGQFYMGLALVSREWKQFTEEAIAKVFANTLPINIDWDEVPEETAAKCVAWVCRNKLRLGRIRWICNARDARTQHFYCSHLMRLLQDCNTIKLTSVDITIHLHYASPTFMKRASSLAYCQRQMVRQRTLQNLVAERCPNLVALGLHFVAVGDENSRQFRKIISPTLFSLPSVRYMAIVLVLHRIHQSTVDALFFNDLIQNMPNLNVLHLGCASNSALANAAIQIKSNSLQDLNVERFDQGVDLQMDCPHLRRLSVRAGYKRHRFGGVWEVIFQQRVTEAENVRSGCVVKVSDAATFAPIMPEIHVSFDHIVGKDSVYVDGLD